MDISKKIQFHTAFLFMTVALLTFTLSARLYSRPLSRVKNNQAAVKTDRIIQHLRHPVTLDGLSSEEAWQEIESLPMVIHSPYFGRQPTEKTEVKIAYDSNHLYLAGRMFDSEPELIQARSKKRDELKPTSDFLGLIIDTFNDNENAVAFFTTPLGIRLDLTIFDDAVGEMPINPSWNTFWDVVAVRNDRGWFVEMRIPLSSIRFQKIDGQVIMGVTAFRYIARKNEMIIFPAIPPEWGAFSAMKPSQTQKVVFKNLQPRKPFYVTPYLLGGLGHSYELNENETAYLRENDPTAEAGLDLKFGLSGNLTADLTLNTDFAQVEADDMQVNLTRFSLFFPEKRLFFQERSSNFDFNLGGPNRLFYSRRIGIYDGRQVPIYGGGRLVGRIGQWDVGLLNMQTAAVTDNPAENFGVFRLRRRVFNPYSYVGGIVTSRIAGDGRYNIVYGLDGIVRVFGDDYIKFHWAQSFENELANDPFSLDPSRFSLSWEKRKATGFAYDLSLSRSGPAFNPGLGFQMRENYTRAGSRLMFGWLPDEKSPLVRHQIQMNGNIFLANDKKRLESAEFGPAWDFEFKSGLSGIINVKGFHENIDESFSLSDDVDIPVGQYTFYGLEGLLFTPMNKMLHTMVTIYAGTFYDGRRFSLGLIPAWSLSSSFELSGMLEFNQLAFPLRNDSFQAIIGRLRILYMLNTRITASAFIQYNSADDDLIANVRLRYNPREGNDLYLVYNEGFNTNRFGQQPHMPFSNNRAILLKYTYTFNIK